MRSMGWRSGDRAGTVEVIDTGPDGAASPGSPRPLPVLVSPIVDARHGATASLGIPAADRTDAVDRREGGDRAAAGRRDGGLGRRDATGAPLRDHRLLGRAPAQLGRADPDRLLRRLRDRAGAEGAAAGRAAEGPEDRRQRPAARRRRDVRRTRSARRAAARRDARRTRSTATSTRSGRGCRSASRTRTAPSAMFDHPQTARWLPVTNVIRGTDGAGFVFDQRSFTKMLRDVGLLTHIEDGEPFTNQRMIGLVRFDGKKMSKHLRNTVELKQMLEEVGADTLRVAMLYAAAPKNDFHWTDEPIRYCAEFLEQLWDWAAPRLRRWQELDASARERIDGGTRLRRKLDDVVRHGAAQRDARARRDRDEARRRGRDRAVRQAARVRAQSGRRFALRRSRATRLRATSPRRSARRGGAADRPAPPRAAARADGAAPRRGAVVAVRRAAAAGDAAVARAGAAHERAAARRRTPSTARPLLVRRRPR